MQSSSRLSLVLILALAAATGCLPSPEDSPKVNFGGPAHQTTVVFPAAEATPPAPAGITLETVPVSASGDLQAARAVRPGRLWVVVKNLEVKSFGIDTDVTAEWEVVQGSPDSGARYVLRVSDGDSGGPVEHFVDFDLDLSLGSGTIRAGVRGEPLGVRGGLYAIVGKASEGGLAQDDIQPVSGKATIGRQSDPTPPPTTATVVPASGLTISAPAGGMPIALANPRREPRKFGSPRGGWSVDYQLAGDFRPGERYAWVVEDAAGNRVVFDVTSDLILPTRPKIGTFSGTPLGPARVSGSLKMFIERTTLATGRQSAGEIVSNTVTLD